MMAQYDYVVIGAGSAGCVVATDVLERILSKLTPTSYLIREQIQIHCHAQRAAEAAQAAAVQGLFWQMHDILFAHQQELGNGYLIEYANEIGLNVSQFLQDIFQQVHLDRIKEDIQSGLLSGVTATPALFINGIRYTGCWKIEQLTAAIVTASS